MYFVGTLKCLSWTKAVSDGRAHRIALLVVIPETRDDNRRGYGEDKGGGGEDVGIVPSSWVRRG